MNKNSRMTHGIPVNIRPYSSETDTEVAARLLKEVGWLDSSSSVKMKHLDTFYSAGRTLIAELDRSPECMGASIPAKMLYRDQDIDISAVTSVTTGIAARRLGLALDLTAQLIAEDAAEYADVAMLGMFDQGFYDRLGFGAGPYDNIARFDPGDLISPIRPRPPHRLTENDGEEIHKAMLARKRGHGGCNLLPPAFIKSDILLDSEAGEQFVGMGYHDGSNGELTHFFCGWMKGENGPLLIKFSAWQNREQLLELIGLIGSLSDQIWSVRLEEPAGIQIQDLFSRPIKRFSMTKGGDARFRTSIDAMSTWQARIMNLSNCIARTQTRNGPVRFNLELDDPITARLSERSPWKGIGGKWIVTFDSESCAEAGYADDLPTMKASVGAFTRMWLGAAPATGIATTDAMQAPDTLLAELDEALMMPNPKPAWLF